MIYLDVTSACRSALNTGVKRIQRGMHASLQGKANYHPICWQSARGAYRDLNKEDRSTLEQERSPRGLALMDSFAPGALTDRLHFFRDRAAMIDLAQILRKDDVLLVPDLVWDNRGNYLARLRRTGARRIGIFHDAIALHRHGESRIDAYHCRRGIRALAQLDGVICISREAETHLRHYWKEEKLRQAPTSVTPWPVPFGGTRPFTVPNFSARTLLYVARLEPHKNHLRLLEACEALWREGLAFQLELIGCLAYPDAAWKILRRLRALSKSGRAIRWRAHVEEEELHAAYRDCTATVFPSLLEGFGLPIIESLWHGRPVVCGTNGALGEIAAGGGCENVDTEDTANLADGLRRVLFDEKRYAALCAEAAARPFRSWEDYWDEVDDFCHGRSTTA